MTADLPAEVTDWIGDQAAYWKTQAREAQAEAGRLEIANRALKDAAREAMERAEQAEAERDDLRKRLDWAIEQADKQFRARREAEAAIERVRAAVAIHPFAEDASDLHRGYRICSERALAALTAPETAPQTPAQEPAQ